MQVLYLHHFSHPHLDRGCVTGWRLRWVSLPWDADEAEPGYGKLHCISRSLLKIEVCTAGTHGLCDLMIDSCGGQADVVSEGGEGREVS